MKTRIRWKLKEVMRDRDKSCAELAQELGVHRQQVWAHRDNIYMKAFRASTLLQYCEALQCEPGDLISLEYCGDG